MLKKYTGDIIKQITIFGGILQDVSGEIPKIVSRNYSK